MFEHEGFAAFAQQWLPQIEEEMRAVLANPDPIVRVHYGMMQYHMGWADEAFQPGEFDRGKRIRPLLCLMACQAAGGDPALALPPAAAVEILHNFSLIHDDIEDGDATRRHRPTLWAQWGVAQAINAGDGMFALSYVALQRAAGRGATAGCVLAALQRFSQTCIALTEGQHLDLSFESRAQVGVAEYLRMIEGKTASLIAGAIAIGALFGGASPQQEQAFYSFGVNLGLAFQIQDDILGIWGDPAVTGKAAGNDILRRKKSLPLLHALAHPAVAERLQRLWDEAPTAEEQTARHLRQIEELLAEAGARAFAQEKVLRYHRAALAALEQALGAQAARSPLAGLADGLLTRQA